MAIWRSESWWWRKLVAKPEWGTKRKCQGCGAHFYDLRRAPIVCPKCRAELKPQGQLRPPRSRAPARPPVKPMLQSATVADEVPAAEMEVENEVNGGGPDDGTVALEKGTGEDDEEVIEDASEFGEDKDDLFEVIDNVEEGKGVES